MIHDPLLTALVVAGFTGVIWSIKGLQSRIQRLEDQEKDHPRQR
jgi:uncharacterized membrane protein HdeD (DUF308 family)